MVRKDRHVEYELIDRCEELIRENRKGERLYTELEKLMSGSLTVPDTAITRAEEHFYDQMREVDALWHDMLSFCHQNGKEPPAKPSVLLH